MKVTSLLCFVLQKNVYQRVSRGAQAIKAATTTNRAWRGSWRGKRSTPPSSFFWAYCGKPNLFLNYLIVLLIRSQITARCDLKEILMRTTFNIFKHFNVSFTSSLRLSFEIVLWHCTKVNYLISLLIRPKMAACCNFKEIFTLTTFTSNNCFTELLGRFWCWHLSFIILFCFILQPSNMPPTEDVRSSPSHPHPSPSRPRSSYFFAWVGKLSLLHF